MRSLPVEFLESVEDDLRYAHSFYDSWQFEGAKRFQERFRETVFWIGWNPEMFPRRYKHFRRANMSQGKALHRRSVNPEM